MRTRGNKVDYVTANYQARKEVKRFIIEKRIEPDHLPMIVQLYVNKRKKNKEKEKHGVKEIRI